MGRSGRMSGKPCATEAWRVPLLAKCAPRYHHSARGTVVAMSNCRTHVPLSRAFQTNSIPAKRRMSVKSVITSLYVESVTTTKNFKIQLFCVEMGTQRLRGIESMLAGHRSTSWDSPRRRRAPSCPRSTGPYRDVLAVT